MSMYPNIDSIFYIVWSRKLICWIAEWKAVVSFPVGSLYLNLPFALLTTVPHQQARPQGSILPNPLYANTHFPATPSAIPGDKWVICDFNIVSSDTITKIMNNICLRIVSGARDN